MGGIAEDTVMPANAATQIHVSSEVIFWNSSLSITSFGRSTSANSRTNGLPASTPIRATRKIPALLSGCNHRSMNDWLSVNVSTVRIKNVATAPISRVRPGAPLTRPIAKDSTATASATNTAVANGTLPTSTQ
jgi:hypothetical protein